VDFAVVSLGALVGDSDEVVLLGRPQDHLDALVGETLQALPRLATPNGIALLVEGREVGALG